MALNALRQLRLPIHDHASEHKVLRALKRYRTKERLERAAQKRPCAEVAADRIREFLWDLGAEKEWYRWIAGAGRDCGLTKSTAYELAVGKKTRVGPNVVDQVSLATGIPVAVFYDEET